MSVVDTEPPAPPAREGASPAGLTITAFVYDVRDPLLARSDDAIESFEALVAALSQTPDVPPASVVKAWSADGIRLVSAPSNQARTLLSRLKPARPIQQVQFGEMLKPTPIYAGAHTDDDIRITRPEEVLTLPAGSLRLLGRSYVVPGALLPDGTASSQLRLDLAIQHFDPALANARPDNAFETVRERPAEDQGGILGTLDFSVDLPLGATLILTCVKGEPPEASTNVSGPPLPDFPNVGEALFTDFMTLPQPRLRTVLLIESRGLE